MLFGKMSGNFSSQASMLALLTNKNPILRQKHKRVYRVGRAELGYRLECHSLTDISKRAKE
jgi:hypothetical protein